MSCVYSLFSLASSINGKWRRNIGFANLKKIFFPNGKGMVKGKKNYLGFHKSRVCNSCSVSDCCILCPYFFSLYFYLGEKTKYTVSTIISTFVTCPLWKRSEVFLWCHKKRGPGLSFVHFWDNGVIFLIIIRYTLLKLPIQTALFESVAGYEKLSLSAANNFTNNQGLENTNLHPQGSFLPSPRISLLYCTLWINSTCN